MMFWGPHSGLGLALAAFAVLADQLHKGWTIALLKATPGAKIRVTPFFDLELAWNTGISYGLFKQDGFLGQAALIVLALAAIVLLVYWLAHLQTRLAAAAVGLIIGGALGNAIDRLRHGAVADFFSFHAFGFHWYVFNLADVAIVAGVLALLYESFKSSHKRVGNRV
jgi:signal peptidase II